MSPKELISKEKKQSILLYVKEGQLAFNARDNKLSQELRQNLAMHKEEIVTYLSKNVTISSQLEKYKNQRLNGKEANMSFSQQRLWFIDQLEMSNSQYNMS